MEKLRECSSLFFSLWYTKNRNPEGLGMPMPWKYLRISRRLPCDKSISAVYLLMMAAVRFGPLLYFLG